MLASQLFRASSPRSMILTLRHETGSKDKAHASFTDTQRPQHKLTCSCITVPGVMRSSAAPHAPTSTSTHLHGRPPTHHSTTQHARGSRHLGGHPVRTACGYTRGSRAAVGLDRLDLDPVENSRS
eukprot:909691-Prymnesium_polylepis.1